MEVSCLCYVQDRTARAKTMVEFSDLSLGCPFWGLRRDVFLVRDVLYTTPGLPSPIPKCVVYVDKLNGSSVPGTVGDTRAASGLWRCGASIRPATLNEVIYLVHISEVIPHRTLGFKVVVIEAYLKMYVFLDIR